MTERDVVKETHPCRPYGYGYGDGYGHGKRGKVLGACGLRLASSLL